MIIYFILQFIIVVVGLAFVALPEVLVLPWGLDEFMISGVSGFRSLMEFFPPFGTVLTAFLVFIGFKLSVLLLKFFLGSNTPTADV